MTGWGALLPILLHLALFGVVLALTRRRWPTPTF